MNDESKREAAEYEALADARDEAKIGLAKLIAVCKAQDIDFEDEVDSCIDEILEE